jgi:hypothetical protein
MNAPTDLHIGVDVYSSDGHKLGELHRVVLRRRDLTASHIVVDIGFLRSGRGIWEGGLGLDYDRVVPIDLVRQASDTRLDLTVTAEEFKEAPEYSVESFVASVGANYWLYERLRKPEGSVDVKEGTPVWRQDPHEKLGEVDRVLFGPDGVAQAFVIRRGFLLKRDVVLPVRYVTELFDDLVRVDITDDHLEALRDYGD